jgi:hypothetical protein
MAVSVTRIRAASGELSDGFGRIGPDTEEVGK